MEKTPIVPLLLSFILCTSCLNSETKTDTNNNAQADLMNDATNKEDKTPQNTGGKFDLENLTFKESINDILKGNGLSLKDGVSEEQTLLGYEAFENTTPALLKYDDIALNGTFQDNANKIVIHYSAKDSLVGMYELKVYSAEQSNELIKHLKNKLGKASFEKLTTDTDLLNEKKNFIVWENNKGINYYLISVTSLDKSPQTTYTELTVMDTKKKGVSDWIKFRSFDWYKK